MVGQNGAIDTVIDFRRSKFSCHLNILQIDIRWRKICGRSAKNQIGDSIYLFFFTISNKNFAKGAQKTLHLAMPDIGRRKKKQHITMTFWLLPFIRANNNRFIE